MAEMRSAIPCFPVADVGATIRWYEEQLGFIGEPFPETEPYVFAIIYRDQIEIMLQRMEGYQKPDLYSQRPGGIWDAYIRLEGVKDLYESVRQEATIVNSLRQLPYGAWEFEVRDLNGYILVFSEFEQ
jgi:hypothetical protein